MTVKIVTYHALGEGKALTVLGAVHGNEPCGTEAIKRVIDAIDMGDLVLERGILRLIPVSNPRAYANRVRYIDRNLNRSLYPKENKIGYEDYLDPILCVLLDQTDVVLDLHSFASQGNPFIFLEDGCAEEEAYARSLSVNHFVYGWSDAFGIMHDKESQGTVEYARYKGKMAVTLECGHHEDARAVEVGYKAIIQSLFYFNMIDLSCSVAKQFMESQDQFQNEKKNQCCIKMRTVHYHEDKAVFAKPWRHLDRVLKDEPMAFLGEDQVLVAPVDGFIILPKMHAKTGEEWFYFGVSANFPNQKALVNAQEEWSMQASL